MSKTPRSDAEIKKIPLKGVFGVARLCEELEIELEQARAEIERKDETIDADRIMLSARESLISRQAKLIEQMREALKALRSYTDSVLQKKDSNAEMRRVAKLCDDAEANAALSAAERGE